MAECKLRKLYLEKGKTKLVSIRIYNEYKRYSNMIRRRISCGNLIESATYIEDEKNRTVTEKGKDSREYGDLEKLFIDMTITGRNPRLVLEIKDLLEFVFHHLAGADMIAICKYSIMESLPDKFVMQKLGITSQSTFAYKKEAVQKKLKDIGKMIPEYRGFEIPTPIEFRKPPRQRNGQANNNQEEAPVEE